MPLMKSGSKKAFSKNVETEMAAGKPQKQSLAIAYSMKRKAKKMAAGGPVLPIEDGRMQSDAHQCDMCGSTMHSNEEHEHDRHDDKGEPMMAEGGMMTKNGYQSSSAKMHQTHDGNVDDQDTYTMDHAGNFIKQDKKAMREDDRDLNQHGEHEEGDQMGGEGFHDESYKGNPGNAHDEYQSEDHDMDMVGRIMKQRQQHYSEGGMVANKNQGVSSEDLDAMADGRQNEMDDLALRDHLEMSETGANSGDELGDKQEDMDRKDIVSRIMASRRKKDRLPNPR
jgi:hypothetical protein